MSIFDGVENVGAKDKKQRVFYCFDGKEDHWRIYKLTPELPNILGQKILTPQQWELVAKRGKEAIKQWTIRNLEVSQCVVVFIGSRTSEREIVLEQIRQAWEMKKPMIGVCIHHCDDVAHKCALKGDNPFELVTVDNVKLSDKIAVYDPPSRQHKEVVAYIQQYIQGWITTAIVDNQF